MTINCKEPIEISNLHSLESALSGVIKTLKYNQKFLRAAPRNYQINRHGSSQKTTRPQTQAE